MVTRRGPTQEQRAKAPTVKTKSAGKVNRRLETLAKTFLAKNPDQDVRFVYHPQHKPDLSNVISRQADGYRLVKLGELGEEIVASTPEQTADDLVRVGDVVLMSIDAGMRKQFQAELDQRARDELLRVEEEFHSAITDIEADERYKPRPRGRSVIEEVEREVPVDPSLKE